MKNTEFLCHEGAECPTGNYETPEMREMEGRAAGRVLHTRPNVIYSPRCNHIARG